MSTVVAVRSQNTFYEAKTEQALAGTGRDLIQTGHSDPAQLPQIQAPGLDPLQVLTLLGASLWPDSVTNAEPVVSADSSGQHTVYQLTVITAKLAAHEPAADRTWLKTLAADPQGAAITLDATITQGRLNTLSATLPVPMPQAMAKKVGEASALPTPAPMSVYVSQTFSYSIHPAAIPRLQ